MLGQCPPSQSYNAKVKIRVADSFGNATEKNSPSSFSITYVPPETPENIIIDISNNRDAVISWDPVTETIYGTPIIPDGYLVLYNENPYEDDQYYYFLTQVPGETYTHQYVAHWRDQMYYRIVAFKDYDGKLQNILSAACGSKTPKLSWAEIKSLLAVSKGGAK